MREGWNMLPGLLLGIHRGGRPLFLLGLLRRLFLRRLRRRLRLSRILRCLLLPLPHHLFCLPEVLLRAATMRVYLVMHLIQDHACTLHCGHHIHCSSAWAHLHTHCMHVHCMHTAGSPHAHCMLHTYLRQLFGAVGDEWRLRLRLYHLWSGHLELDRPLALRRLLAGLGALGVDRQSIQRFDELRRQGMPCQRESPRWAREGWA